MAPNALSLVLLDHTRLLKMEVLGCKAQVERLPLTAWADNLLTGRKEVNMDGHRCGKFEVCWPEAGGAGIKRVPYRVICKVILLRYRSDVLRSLDLLHTHWATVYLWFGSYVGLSRKQECPDNTNFLPPRLFIFWQPWGLNTGPHTCYHKCSTTFPVF